MEGTAGSSIKSAPSNRKNAEVRKFFGRGYYLDNSALI